MAARCVKHAFEGAAAQCRSCGEPFCQDCLVYTYGPQKPPFCVPCALVAAGVRRVSSAERKLMKANRGQKVEIAETPVSRNSLVVTEERPTVPVAVETDEAPQGEAAPAKRTRRFPLAWLVALTGALLVAVPMVTNG